MAFRLAPTALVASLYVAYFNRAVESAGLTYWHNQYRAELANSGNEDDTSAQLSAWIYQGGQDEAALAEPISDAEFIASIYENLLGRGRPALEGVDRDGFNFWLGKLENGHVSRAEFAAAFISGISAVNDPEGAAKFALVLKTALTWARSDASQGLDDAALRAAGIKALQDALYPPEPQPEPEPEPQPEPQPQPQPEPEPDPEPDPDTDNIIHVISGDEIVRGTAGRDIFMATLQQGGPDFRSHLTLIDGLGSRDKLVIEDTATFTFGTFSLGDTVVLQNIEELSITTSGGFLSGPEYGDLSSFAELELFELVSHGMSPSTVHVSAATNVDIDTNNIIFTLTSDDAPGEAGTTHVTVRNTNGLTIVGRHDITIDTHDEASSILSVLVLERASGEVILNTPTLNNLSLINPAANIDVTANVSGNMALTVSLETAGTSSNPLALSIAVEEEQPTGYVSLQSMGTEHNVVDLTLVAAMPLRAVGSTDMTLTWSSGGSGGVAGLVADQFAGDLTVDLTTSGFDSVNVTLGSGDDTITVDLAGNVDGGAGNDTFVVRAPGVTLTGGAGDDTFDLRDAAVDGGSSVSVVTITDLGIGDRIQLAGVTTLATDRVTITGQPHLSLDALLASEPIALDLGVASLITITGSTVWMGEYLLIQNGDNVLDSNDVLVRLENVSPDDGVMLTHQEGYDFISLV